MTWADFAGHVAALLVYPGGLAALAAGLLAEGVAGRLAPAVSWTGWPASGHFRPRRVSALSWFGGLLALLAAVEAGFPLAPLPAAETSILVAGVAICAAGWAAWAWGGGSDAAWTLGVQVAWMIALVTPGIVPQDLRPTTLGALTVPALLPLRVCSAVVYVVCLPYLLQLATPAPGESAAGRSSGGPIRLLLWLPLCGLFAAAYFPPPTSWLTTALFFAIAAAMGLVSVVLGRQLGRFSARTNRRLLIGLTTLTVLAALLSAALVRTG